MNIKEAVNRTGLTKKAIRYYEEKGLIEPGINEDNGYRIYSNRDIQDLHQIAFLRNIELSIPQIDDYLKHPELRNDILSQHLKEVESRISHMKAINDSILQVIADKDINFASINTYLTEKQMVNQDFVLKRLGSLFPDKLGKFFILHFGAFLLEPLDTDEKKEAFKKMIEYLDNSDDIIIPEEMLSYYEEVDEQTLVEVFSATHKRMQELVSIDVNNEEELSQLKYTIEGYKELEENEAYKEPMKQMREMKERFRRSLEESGYYMGFVENLKKLSSHYRDYYKQMEKLDIALGLREF